MTPLLTPPDPAPDAATLYRYVLVSQVLARLARGESQRQAIEQVLAAASDDSPTSGCPPSARSLYRWCAAYRRHGFNGLKSARRTGDAYVVSPELIAFFKAEKSEDFACSTPELIRRAQQSGLLNPQHRLDRTTVWRRLRRENLDMRRTQKPPTDCRRFAYPHRLDMVLCDGKHFRAGFKRHKRVALFFLDDATRYGLSAVVGTSETTNLFLRGVYDVIERHGLMDLLFVDNGSGFISHDSLEVLRQLGVHFVHGTVGYPEGRAKVERFNRTVAEQVLRHYPGNPQIDSGCAALELRLRHYLFEQYNHQPHESLQKQIPQQRFQADSKALRFAESQAQLRQHFVLSHRRRVSADQVVSLNGIHYETPFGYANQKIVLRHNLLTDEVALQHGDRLITLSAVDVHANAQRRRRATPASGSPEPQPGRTQSAADRAFERELGSLLDPDGGFVTPPDRQEPTS